MAVMETGAGRRVEGPGEARGAEGPSQGPMRREQPSRVRRVAALLSGFLAGGTALLVLLVGRFLTARPGFLEAVADGVIRYLPLDLFEAGLSTFGPLAKGLLFASVAAGVPAAGAVFALALASRALRLPPPAEALVIAAVVLLLAEAVVLPLAGAGPFALSAAGDGLPLHAPLLAASLSYGIVLVGLRNGWQPTAQASPPVTTTAGVGIARRTFLGRALALLGAGSLAGSFVVIASHVLDAARRRVPVSAGLSAGDFGPTPALTPVPDFYQVSKNLLPTVVDGASWRLKVDGLVERPLELTLAELRAMPAHEGYRTLECISLEIVRGDDLIGNQKWRGVRAAELLDRAGVQPAARFVLWEAEDGYTESIPLAVARNPETWIAYEMGGAALTPEHGFPARVLIPGRFGMKQPKWLRRIQLAERDVAGYWEQRGWDAQAFVKTMSRIDEPQPGDSVPAARPFTVYGIANSGDRGISRVEVSPDDASTWLAAEVEDATVPPLGPLTWVRWRVQVTLPKPGPARLVVRATDGKGQLQDGRETSALPSGSTGWHAIRVVAE
jgi:DMSO/TMAO reductase YedYZ molybdopterin-dependent catalytic subunit